MNVSLDTKEYVNQFGNKVPLQMQFDAGGEAVCGHLGVSLNTTDDKAWVDYSIKGEGGKPLPLTRPPVAKGSYVAVAKNGYLETHAKGRWVKRWIIWMQGRGPVRLRLRPFAAASIGKRYPA